jgi:hypothetical protein
MGSFTNVIDGRVMLLRGDTYPIRDKLRSLGFRWDPGKKAWFIPITKWDYVSYDLASIRGYQPSLGVGKSQVSEKPATSNQKALLKGVIRHYAELGGDRSSIPDVDSMTFDDAGFWIEKLRSAINLREN